jgi:hypothetical protein
MESQRTYLRNEIILFACPVTAGEAEMRNGQYSKEKGDISGEIREEAHRNDRGH